MKQLVKQCAISAANQFGPHRFAIPGRPAQLWIMMYHRILPSNDLRYRLEEPGMIVTPETFSMHLREIKRYFDVIDLEEWINLRATGQHLPERACAITFDDGWHDNYEFALPIIKQANVPVTLFAVVDKMGTNFQFWPNLISALLVSNASKAMQEHPIFAKIFSEITPPPNTNDREYIAAVIKLLKQFSDIEIFNALEKINWQKYLTFDLPRGLMNWDEIQTMISSGLVKIGSHTCNHIRLDADISNTELCHEIETSKQLLKEKIPDAIDIFCFPNGDYNPLALNLVAKTYNAAVTTRRGIVNALTTPTHQLCRIGLHENMSHTPRLLGARLSGWI
ncbi:MAG: polysaccharide deacetylase family protein [Cellvibrio sp.]|uniref:polysaccharide deacetylase family protein n=1 Tax=Cellvibrio sp. TaxID=1965322 RepID=UPI00319F7A0A